MLIHIFLQMKRQVEAVDGMIFSEGKVGQLGGMLMKLVMNAKVVMMVLDGGIS